MLVKDLTISKIKKSSLNFWVILLTNGQSTIKKLKQKYNLQVNATSNIITYVVEAILQFTNAAP